MALYKVDDTLVHTEDGVSYECKVISSTQLNKNQVFVGDTVTYVNPDGKETDAKVVSIATNGPNGQTLNLDVSGKKGTLDNVGKYAPHNAKVGSWKIKAEEVVASEA